VDAQPRLGGDHRRHVRGRMTIKERASARLEIEVVIAVYIPEIGPAAAIEIKRGGDLHFPDAAVDAAGYGLCSPGKHQLGFGEGVGHDKNLFQVISMRWEAMRFGLASSSDRIGSS